jgi:hypothetical protein
MTKYSIRICCWQYRHDEMGGGKCRAISSSRRSDQAPRVTNFLIEMISGGGFGRSDQKRLHALVDHEAAFSVLLVEVQVFERFDHASD